MSSYHWSLVNSTPTAGGRTFARTLGPAEHSFYYDRITNGTADILWHYTLKLVDPSQAASLFSEANVGRAWATVKQYYPLLGACMEPQTDGTVKFIVNENALVHHQPDEITIQTIESVEDAMTLIWRGVRDKPTEDSHIMTRVFVLARADQPGTFEVIFKAAHAISDAMSGATLARTFFDVVSAPPIQVPALEKRLAMALPSNALNPSLKMSLARQRWRRAIGKVTFMNMRSKLSGGHTLPRTVTEKTYRTPATTSRVFLRLSSADSRAILDGCRRHKVTFGSAIPVIAQMALTRLLHRRYLRGDIFLEEWEYRRRQPMHYGGPVNLRPYLDEEWQRAGGVSEMLLMIDYYDCTLPFMPSPYGARRDAGVPRVDGAPPYSALLSRPRFFHRASLAKQQLARTVRHPLLLEIAHARQPLYVTRKKKIAVHWQADLKGELLPPFPELDKLDHVSPDYCFSGALSSIGDMTAILPDNYPLPPTHPLSIRTAHAPPSPAYGTVGDSTSKTTPSEIKLAAPTTLTPAVVLQIVDSQTYLHGRPMEFILSSATARGHIDLTLTYDANVYRTEDAEEYMRECRLAALYYFGNEEAGPTKGKL
ncbi:hypothetical protein C8Q77DRAFT_1215834 [Trametes polyzona]|nr:hypothetical protein C8Q77DRAFT_1215834 [Trametes polyzona]